MTREEAEEIIAAMRAAIQSEMAAQEERLLAKFHQHVDNMSATLEESIRDRQTEVLRAVMSAQESNTARLGLVEAADASVLHRMATMERRLLEIEKRLGGGEPDPIGSVQRKHRPIPTLPKAHGIPRWGVPRTLLPRLHPRPIALRANGQTPLRQCGIRDEPRRKRLVGIQQSNARAY